LDILGVDFFNVHPIQQFDDQKHEQENQLEQQNHSELNGEVVVDSLFIISSIFVIQPVISERGRGIVIIPGSVFENFLVPVDHVLEEIMQESQQIVREVAIVETVEGEHLAHQESLKQFLVEEIVEGSVVQVGTTHADSNDSSQHGQKEEQESENGPNSETFLDFAASVFLSSPGRISLLVIPNQFVINWGSINEGKEGGSGTDSGDGGNNGGQSSNGGNGGNC